MGAVALNINAQHKIEHKEFVEKLDQVNWDKVKKDQDKAILEILDFFNEWLVNHILYTDQLYSQKN